ncbi:hypothetical protein [Sphingomonas abietis]|uniref:Phosphate starvation-inducible protein PsiF n=1 Tax=Sphingomonas abietis TaxID=3012344 RepID=A0ABY7NK96_9SPHN|nr:hypothetical protein [Sphingomonas abietis]WBO21662.1 hypothetical protein PBT88_16000 [Sphingomonas abietis]
MIRTLTALSVTALLATSLVAAPCKDAKGKFTKCPPAATAAAAPAAFNKDAKGRCHVASGPKKGQLMKCPK